MTAPREVNYFKPWLVFFVVGGLGAQFGAILTANAITPFIQFVGARDEIVRAIDWLIRLGVVLLISFTAFRFVVRRFFVATTASNPEPIEPGDAADREHACRLRFRCLPS